VLRPAVLAVQLEKDGVSPTVDGTTSVSNPLELVFVDTSADQKLVERGGPSETEIARAISRKVIELREPYQA